MTITAATDGSARHNPTGPAGWSWWVSAACWAAGGMPAASNNEAELTAVVQLLHATAHLAGEPLHIVADSRYTIDALTVWWPGWQRRGWRTSKGTPVANQHLIRAALDGLTGRDVTFTWVRGHAGHPLNTAADAAATAASAAVAAGTPIPSGPGWNTTPTLSVAEAAAAGTRVTPRPRSPAPKGS